MMRTGEKLILYRAKGLLHFEILLSCGSLFVDWHENSIKILSVMRIDKNNAVRYNKMSA